MDKSEDVLILSILMWVSPFLPVGEDVIQKYFFHAFHLPLVSSTRTLDGISPISTTLLPTFLYAERLLNLDDCGGMLSRVGRNSGFYTTCPGRSLRLLDRWVRAVYGSSTGWYFWRVNGNHGRLGVRGFAK